MRKYNICVLFGGISPEHEVSLRSAEAVLQHVDPEKYNEEIREINNEHRGIDKATDVLSFPMLEFDEEGNALEDRFQQMVAVLPFAHNVQADIDFCIGS